jgi:hypothetical protein
MRSLVISGSYHLFETVKNPKVFQIPEHDVHNALETKLRMVLSTRLIDDVYEEIPAGATISGPTMGKVREVGRFIQRYKQENKRYPDINTITNYLNVEYNRRFIENLKKDNPEIDVSKYERNPRFKFKKETVEKFIDANNLFGAKRLDDLAGAISNGKMTNGDGGIAIEKFLVSEGPLPEEIALDHEEKKIWQNAVDRNLEKLKSKVRGSHWEGTETILTNFDRIMKRLIDEGGKKQTTIVKEFGLDSVPGGLRSMSRLWAYFVDLIKKDHELINYVKANVVFRSIIKLSYDVVQKMTKIGQNETIITKVVQGICGK